MRQLLFILLPVVFSCSEMATHSSNDNTQMTFTEKEILGELDLAFNNRPSKYYPTGGPDDIKYNFFLDLEHGYCQTAGSRIHLYADSSRWIIVFEKSGYQNRANSAEIELSYVGNCINYSVDEYLQRKYITNSGRVILIEPSEFERIEYKDDARSEAFELIESDITEIKVRDQAVPFNNDYLDYERFGISIRDTDNPNKLIGFGDFIRYLHESIPSLISATETEIRKYIPNDIPKLMVIEKFHFSSAYEKENPPSQQETYQLLAKVLVTRDSANWKPTQRPNNSWRNWDSGNL